MGVSTHLLGHGRQSPAYRCATAAAASANGGPGAAAPTGAVAAPRPRMLRHESIAAMIRRRGHVPGVAPFSGTCVIDIAEVPDR
jgi:hypothetical protein